MPTYAIKVESTINEGDLIRVNSIRGNSVLGEVLDVKSGITRVGPKWQPKPDRPTKPDKPGKGAK